MTDLVLMVMGGAVLALWALGLLAWAVVASLRKLRLRVRTEPPSTMHASRRPTRPSVRPRLFNQDENGRYRVVG